MSVRNVDNGQFKEKLLSLLDRVEYRRVESSEDMEDIARLRFKAYKAVDLMPMTGSTLVDRLDFDSHAFVFGIYLDERLISTVRVHHVTPDHRASTAGAIFAPEVASFLDAGMTLVDPGRFAADPELDGEEGSAIPYLTLRVAAMASEHFDVDRCLTACRPRHAAFYKRVFAAETIVREKKNLGVYNADGALLVARVREIRPWLYQRYPVFDSKPFERRMMFGGAPSLPFMPLTIRPTARLAQVTHRREALGLQTSTH
ncbi:N-acyl amino acid synthase FeeM domain-containing protein [Pararhizobium sp.]|uniref:N-acyl amino acid synthase FeeM domain-containing protein n=1 Tax=Pararhizobium sp. TaxID=1977563 RepID=UPI002726F79A|nr:hypothetical protein [Pararhizobium sp.]MDO9415233.1 hypothetical protein [Pararhizobium sp.]